MAAGISGARKKPRKWNERRRKRRRKPPAVTSAICSESNVNGGRRGKREEV